MACLRLTNVPHAWYLPVAVLCVAKAKIARYPISPVEAPGRRTANSKGELARILAVAGVVAFAHGVVSLH